MVKKLSETLEMYVKTILVLEREFDPVRVSQIAKARGVSAASVTEAIRTLQDKGLIRHKAYGGVRLTPQGRRMARTIVGRYKVLYRFLNEVLGLSEAAAEREACEFEHVISPESVERLAAFLEFANRGGQGLSDSIARFHDYYKKGQ
jgi:DtxR family Mn-dependent transcriptional regulator